ncbi:MAG: ADP-ribosyltransferase [Ancrocorticia sp.]
MSELQDLLVVLDGVAKDAEQHAARLAQHAHQLGQSASSAASATQGSARADGKNTAAALQSAQRSVSQAAQQLHQAALAGKRFVARYAGGTGGSAGGGSGSGGRYDVSSSTTSGLSSADVAALRDYTGSGFRSINESLRGGAAMSSDTNQRAEAISDTLAKLPDRTGPVFRGTTLSSEQIASYVPGAVHPEAGFTSTSSDPKSAFPGNTLFLVISKHGKDISPYSHYAESEVLFDKGTGFLVTSNFFSPQEGKQVIIMMEV